MRYPLAWALYILVLSTATAAAQTYNSNNFADRQALIVNASPYVELSNFNFGNVDARNYRSEFRQNLQWRNIGQQPIVSFEVVIVKYDPFGRNLIGTRWLVNGHDSANWAPLPAGKSAGDGTISHGEEDVFTAVAYVRHVRLADGTIWAADVPAVSKKILELAPNIREVGNISPEVSSSSK